MDISINRFDSLEQMIYDENIRIKAIDVHPDMDLLVVILNTGSVLKEKLSVFFDVNNLKTEQLLNYTLIGNGTGIHWSDFDEDLSLKGLLRDTLKNQLLAGKVA